MAMGSQPLCFDLIITCIKSCNVGMFGKAEAPTPSCALRSPVVLLNSSQIFPCCHPLP